MPIERFADVIATVPTRYRVVYGESVSFHNNIGVTFSSPLIGRLGDSPVSYTHLDVYKRQLLYFKNIFKESDKPIHF